jgi:hypothetical protein
MHYPCMKKMPAKALKPTAMTPPMGAMMLAAPLDAVLADASVAEAELAVSAAPTRDEIADLSPDVCAEFVTANTAVERDEVVPLQTTSLVMGCVVTVPDGVAVPTVA